MNSLIPRRRSCSALTGRSLLALLLVLSLPLAWAGPAPVTGSAASATVTGTSPVTMQFPLARSGGDSGYPVWLHFQTQDGTAVAGSDYTAEDSQVQLAPGGSTASIPVQILGASTYSPDKQFSLNLLSAVGVGPTPGFAAQQTFATGTHPVSVAAVDVNGDGKPDLIVANQTNNTVSVRLNITAPGASTQSFATQQTFTIDNNPVSVTAADVNGDGKPDLIVANLMSNTVSVLLNTTAAGASTPSFAIQQTFATDHNPDSVTAADVNGDGKPDLIVANASSNTVSVLLNTTEPGAAAPSFAAQQTFATGTHPVSVAAVDVNGDGKADLIVANNNSGSVSVLLNTTSPGATTPSFAAQQTFATGNYPESVTAADVNGDGKPDLMVANHDSNTVSVLLNTTAPGASASSFATQQTYATGTTPASVTAADVNGDGKPDLIVANDGNNTVSVLTNTTAPGASSPSFATQQTFATGAYSQSVTAADMNGDGKADLIVANASSNTVSVLLNTTAAPTASAPSFVAQQPFATGSTGSAPQSVLTADINGDGKPDLIVANNNDNTVSVLLNTTAPGAIIPSFATQHSFATGRCPYSVTAADVNGDGKPDLIAANQCETTVSVLLNTTAPGASTPSFAAQQTFTTGTSPISVTAADVNGDGKPDLITADEGSNTLSVLLNTTTPGATTPSFATQQTFGTGHQPTSVTTADVNGDGKPDLIAVNSNSNTASVLLNTSAPGAATLSFATHADFATGGYPLSVTAADVNGDGKPDLIAVNESADTLSVLLNTTAAGAATSSFAAQQTFATGHAPYSVTATDVNGNGKPDLIVTNSGSNNVSVLDNITVPGAATSSFAAQQTFATGSYPVSVTTADMNGDGSPDLIVANNLGNSASVLLDTQYAASVSPSSVTGTIHYAIPEAAFSPDPLAFGNITVGSSSTTTETLTNSGGASLTISSIAISGTHAARFSQSNNCPASLAIGASCAIQVSYAPNALTVDGATLMVSSNTPTSPDAVALSGTGSDTAPTANNGTLSTSTDTAANGVLSATDPDSGQSLTYSIVSQPTHGTVTITDAGTGAYTYTPASGYAGSDSFTFKANDGYKDSNTATVSVTVADTPPTAIGASFSTPTNQALSGQLQGNAGDAGQTLTFALVTNPAHGTVSVNADGSFSYTPDNGYAGSDSFTFLVNDGYQNSAAATASVNVTDTPPTASNTSFSTPVDTAYSGQLKASDPDSGQTLTYSIVTQPAHGTVSITDASTGTYTYTPGSGYTGSDSFTFKANDGYQDSNTARVSASVTDQPPVAQNGSYNLTANSDVSGQLKATASSPSQTLTYTIVSQPAHGTVSLAASTGRFTYTPAHNYTGTDTFTFKANDGTLDSNTAKVTLTVTGGSSSGGGSSGGGGAFGPWGLALLAGLGLLIAALRRKAYDRGLRRR